MDQTPRQPLNAGNLETKPNGAESRTGERSVPELRQSVRMLRDFIEHAAVAMHWVAADGTILWANEAELRLLGYGREEFIGHNIAEFHVDQPVIADILRRLSSDETLRGYEARLRCRDGSIRHVSVSSSVYREEGTLVHTGCITLDITGQKEAAELQERLAAIVASSDDAIIGKNLDGIIISWNRGAERIFGYRAEEVIGKHVAMLAAPDCIDEIPAILDRVSLGESVDHYETRRKTKDGRILTVSLTVSPVRGLDGTVVAALKIARDITVQKGVSELQERLAAIVESSDDAIISKDLNGIIRSWNSGAARLFGYTAGEVVGKPITIIIPPDRLGEEPEILGRLQRGERVDHFETIRRRKDGTLLNISLTISPVKDSRGIVVGASKVARDITERKRQEEALAAVTAALTRSNADLRQFAYSASHDLQEPLRMVSTYGELLKREFGGQLGANGDEYIGYTIQGALRMEQLLQDLRAYTLASTAGQDPTEDIEAGQSLDQALAALASAIRESGACITRTALPRVRFHDFQLTQLFQNLIGNSIRYRGGEPLRIHVAAEPGDRDWLFSVRDNGIGIDPQYKERIFEIFKRLHSAAAYPGTGMGLAICQRIVERAGGNIWVDSALGRGSTFFFTVPRGEGRPDGG